MNTRDEILDLIEEEDIKFIRLQFTDPLGNLKNVAVTDHSLPAALDNRYAVKGGKVYEKAEDEIYLHPDLSTFAILPWRPQQGKVARMICDVYNEDDEESRLSPRAILKKAVKDAAEKGYTFYVNPECEFFLFHTDDNGNPTTLTHETAGYLDVAPLDMGENARRDMVLMLEQMGFDIKSSHHEAAPGQQEIDFEDADPLQTADAVVTFKSAVRSIAKRFGLYATFMPKPHTDDAGSGMHLNVSVYKGDRDLLKQLKISRHGNEAAWFAGGLLKYAPALCSFTNPLVNSYKRNLISDVKLHTRKCEDTKLEVCFPDPSADIYIALALIIKAGLRGIEEKIEPEESLVIEGLPENLAEALKKSADEPLIREILGDEYTDNYIRQKKDEWERYARSVSDWEIEEYLYRV